MQEYVGCEEEEQRRMTRRMMMMPVARQSERERERERTRFQLEAQAVGAPRCVQRVGRGDPGLFLCRVGDIHTTRKKDLTLRP